VPGLRVKDIATMEHPWVGNDEEEAVAVVSYGVRIRTAALARAWRRAFEVTGGLLMLGCLLVIVQSSGHVLVGCNPGSEAFKLVLQKCKGSTLYTIHGLWPQWDGGQHCNAEAFNANALLSIRNELDMFWPSCPGYSWDNTRFWKHEWDKHGSCSDLRLLDYFEHALVLRASTVHKCIFADQSCEVCVSKDPQPLPGTTSESWTSLLVYLLLLACLCFGVRFNSKVLISLFTACNRIVVLLKAVMIGILVGFFYVGVILGFDKCHFIPTLHECSA